MFSMFKNMSVGGRMGWGFAAVLTLMLTISALSVVTLSTMRGAVLHHRGGCPSLNQGKMPWL